MPLFMEKEVRAGMALLDEKVRSGWEGRLDLFRLNIRSVEDCVIGQLFGSWSYGLFVLGIQGRAHSYGFSVPNKVLEGADVLEAQGRLMLANVRLTNTWQALIRERTYRPDEVAAIDGAQLVEDRELVLV